MYENTTHKPGDIVNGHVLTESGWVPIGGASSVVHLSTTQPRPSYPGRGMAIAGMVLGIVAWGIALLSFFMLSGVSFILSLIGLPLSAVALRQSSRAGAPKGIGIAGIVLNAVGLALAAALFLILVIGAAASGGAS